MTGNELGGEPSEYKEGHWNPFGCGFTERLIEFNRQDFSLAWALSRSWYMNIANLHTQASVLHKKTS